MTNAFRKPKDGAIRIWRYMDFVRYVSMLENRGLFFCRASSLDDPFEGSYPRMNEDLIRKVLSSSNTPSETIERMLFERKDLSRWMRQWVLINCWHLNESESYAMWKLYGPSSGSICIQSIFTRLWQALDKLPEIGEVQYVDYEQDTIPDGNIFFPFLYKRRAFAYERELRAILWQLPIKDDVLDRDAVAADKGVWRPIELEALIEKVFVAPYSPVWLRELVKSVNKKYGLDVEVVQSSLEGAPAF